MCSAGRLRCQSHIACTPSRCQGLRDEFQRYTINDHAAPHLLAYEGATTLFTPPSSSWMLLIQYTPCKGLSALPSWQLQCPLGTTLPPHLSDAIKTTQLDVDVVDGGLHWRAR
jgi:hypothetical protein